MRKKCRKVSKIVLSFFDVGPIHWHLLQSADFAGGVSKLGEGRGFPNGGGGGVPRFFSGKTNVGKVPEKTRKIPKKTGKSQKGQKGKDRSRLEPHPV